MDKKIEEPGEQKLCPHLNQPCIQDTCAKYVQMLQAAQLGGQRQVGMCSEVAVTILLSTLIQVMGAKKVNLPNLRP